MKSKRAKKGKQKKQLLLLAFILLVTMNLPGSSARLILSHFRVPITGQETYTNSIFLPFIVNSCSLCYFVDSVDGSDINSGMSTLVPWQSLDRVNHTKFAPGSRIFFKRGSSWTGRLMIEWSGVEGRPIFYTTYGTGPKPVIRNPGDAQHLTNAISIQANWIVVENFLIENTQEAGIFISTDHNIVQDNELTNVGIGVDVEGQYNLIRWNKIHHLNMVVNTPGGNNDDFGATGILMNNGSNNEISFNTITDCVSPSYDFGTGGHAFEWFRVSNNNYVHHNWAVNNNQFLEAGGGEAKGNTIAYNVSVDNGVFSYIHLIGTWSSIVENFRIENNTIVNTNRTDQWADVVGFNGIPNANTFLARNNIFYITGLHLIYDQGNFTHQNNIYFVEGNTSLGFQLNPTEKLVNPLFVDLKSYNFHLSPGSLAIDAGVNLNYHYDFTNAPVPMGSSPDIGAYEFQQ